MINRWKKRPGNSVVGLAIGHDRLEAVELRRTNGSAEVAHTVSVALESDPFQGDPEAAGRALRQHLDAAGIRESSCAICLPPDVLLSLSLPLPDLPDADRESFLQIEAERGFPHDPGDLIMASSASAGGTAGPRHATLLAVPRVWVQKLESILRAARLKPVTIVYGPASLQPANDPNAEGALALVPFGHDLAVQLTCNGAIAGLRVIGDAFGGDAEQVTFDVDHVSRELRITVGQLAPELRSALRRVRVFGRTPAAALASAQLAQSMRPLGLTVEAVEDFAGNGLPFKLPASSPASAALACAAQALAGREPDFEFLPPRLSSWQQLSARYPSGRLAWAGGAIGAFAVLVALAFLGQQIVLWKWQSRWDALKVRVTTLDRMQKEIRLYRPWFDESVRNLSIIRRVTESFPDDGSVFAKTIEIRAGSRVTCTGTARNPDAWMKMLDLLSNARGIADVQVEQVRGKSPMEFTFNFRWEGPGGS